MYRLNYKLYNILPKLIDNFETDFNELIDLAVLSILK